MLIIMDWRPGHAKRNAREELDQALQPGNRQPPYGHTAEVRPAVRARFRPVLD
ncbi:MAG TPA: hypothetical protein VKA15_12245 [Isosphaeraceae bacterium]|nr:hypothetical protein [Isosphaeraceae bacterium]